MHVCVGPQGSHTIVQGTLPVSNGIVSPPIRSLPHSISTSHHLHTTSFFRWTACSTFCWGCYHIEGLIHDMSLERGNVQEEEHHMRGKVGAEWDEEEYD